MVRTVTQSNRTSLFERIPNSWFIVSIVALIALVLVIATVISASQAAGEATAANETYVFDAEDLYVTWSWIIVIGVFTGVTLYGIKQRWAFASTIQIALIIVLTVNFILIAQQIDRDIFGVGVFALIIFTLIQIAFSNIPPDSNVRKSLAGVLITAVVLTAIILFSIWLVPSLILLGR